MEPVAGPSGPERPVPLSSERTAPPAAEAEPVALGPWRCAADPGVETYLRCGHCEKPICPRCLIQTPVGSRCRECAQLRRLPMFVLGPLDYLKVIGVALGASIACGIALALVLQLVPFLGILRFFLMAGLGYTVAEAVTRFTRKQGKVVGIVAGLSAVIGVIVGSAALYMVGGANVVLAFMAASASAVLPLWNLLGLVVAAFMAYSRTR